MKIETIYISNGRRGVNLERFEGMIHIQRVNDNNVFDELTVNHLEVLAIVYAWLGKLSSEDDTLLVDIITLRMGN